MTTAGSGEKVEKRRALGRGLESLLPRVVRPAGHPGGGSAVVGDIQGVVEDGGEQIPFDSAQGKPQRLTPVRNDRELEMGSGENPAELRSAGQPGAAVPTLSASSASVSSPSSSPDTASLSSQIPTLRQAESELSRAEGAGEMGHPDSSSSSSSSQEQRASRPLPHELLPQESLTISAGAEGRMPSNLVVQIPLDHVDKNPYQTRYLFDRDLLEELAESIRANGVVQPIVVRPAEEEGRYVLILGERRLRASKIAGKTSVPAIVRRVSDQQAAEMTVIENLQRQDLNCLEQAEAFRVLSSEFRLTQAQIGERVGMSRESVSNYMRLLRLPERTMELLTENKLSFGAARELLALEDGEAIANAADEVVKKNMTLEQIEDYVLRLQGYLAAKPGMGMEPEKKTGGARWVDPNVRAAQMDLQRVLGLRVRIKDRKGKGKIVIEYATVSDYERVVAMLRK